MKCERTNNRTGSSSKRKQSYEVALRFSKLAMLHHPSSLSSSSTISVSRHMSSTSLTNARCSRNISSTNDDECGDGVEGLSKSIPCVEKKKQRMMNGCSTNPWMRFCFLFSLLQPKLPSSLVASLQLVWREMQACKITREEFIASFRHIAGDQILAESIRNLQSLQARDMKYCNFS